MYRAFASLGNLHEVNIVICSPAAVCQALKRQQFLPKKLTRVKDACTLHCEFTLMYLIGRMLWVVQKSITTEFIGSDVWCFTAFPFPVCSIWQFFLFFFPFMQSPNAGDKDDQMLTVGSNYALSICFSGEWWGKPYFGLACINIFLNCWDFFLLLYRYRVK